MVIKDPATIKSLEKQIKDLSELVARKQSEVRAFYLKGRQQVGSRRPEPKNLKKNWTTCEQRS